jgi:DNA-binding transcriptional regulator PaaX
MVKKIQNKLELTEKGEAELLKFSDYAHKKPKKWDGIWTIVSFDFPINKGRARDVVRFHLKRIGFIQLQQSIWVYPYDCSKLIYLMKAEWNIKDEIVYIRAKYISREKKLKEIFGL